MKEGGGLELKKRKKHKQKTGQETGRINRQSDPSENVANDTVSACPCSHNISQDRIM